MAESKPTHSSDVPPAQKPADKLMYGLLAGAAVIIVAGLITGGVYLRKAAKTRPSATGNQASAATSRFGGSGRFGGGQGRFAGTSPTFGTVTAVSSDQFTMKEQNGTSISAQTSSTTVYGRPGSTAATTIVVGDMVAVIGQANASGVLQATRVLINPDFGGFRGSQAPSASPGSTNSS